MGKIRKFLLWQMYFDFVSAKIKLGIDTIGELASCHQAFQR